MIEIEIDGKKLQAAEGSTIIEVADENGVYIPRFCYHKNLSIAANCRMCLVEIEKMGKPQPACATPVTADMKVFTKSERAMEAQRAVMEFLLINHPLDCPICDQGGECELQDISMGYGRPNSYYTEPKRAVTSDDLGSLIETEMTRCIHCTRCVRFGEEVAGLRELGATGRGEDMHIGTYVKHFVQSEISGNIIDLCPVGALTNKPGRYQGRAWELQEHPMIAAHDCVGTNMYVHTRGRQYSPQRIVMRAVPKENDQINDTWMSDRDRFSVHGLYHEDRIYKPRMKHQGRWIEVEWEKALVEIAASISVIKDHHGSDTLAAIASPNSTVEEFYILQKLMRALGSNNIDHRIRERDFKDQHLTPEFPNLGMQIADIEELETILLIGSHVRFDQPLLCHRINQAVQNEAHVLVVNPVDYPFTFPVKQKVITANIINAVAEIAKVFAEQAGQNLPSLINIVPSPAARQMAERIKISGESAAIFLGDYALHHFAASQLRELVRLIANFSGAKIGVFTEGANSSGAWLAGAVPHRGAAGAVIATPGLNACEMLTKEQAQVYLLLNVEPEFDSAYAEQAVETLKQAGLVICLTTFATPSMLEYADVLLPVTPFTETDGTFVNIEGTWQSFKAVSVPTEDSKPGWKVLRVLANFLKLPGFDYATTKQICDELAEQIDTMSEFELKHHPLDVVSVAKDILQPMIYWPMYRSDALVRRSQALQDAIQNSELSLRLNQATADKHHLKEFTIVRVEQGSSSVVLPLCIDNRVADNVAVIPVGLEQTVGFGQVSDVVQLSVVREGL